MRPSQNSNPLYLRDEIPTLLTAAQKQLTDYRVCPTSTISCTARGCHGQAEVANERVAGDTRTPVGLLFGLV